MLFLGLLDGKTKWRNFKKSNAVRQWAVYNLCEKCLLKKSWDVYESVLIPPFYMEVGVGYVRKKHNTMNVLGTGYLRNS